MRQVVIKKHDETIDLSKIANYTPIFVKLGDKLHGMVLEDNKGWITRIGGKAGATGYHPTRKELIEKETNDFQYTFHVED